MRLLAAIPLSLLAAASTAAAPPRPAAQSQSARGGEIRVDPSPTADPMNHYTQSANCVPIERQVSGEDRRYPGTRLDQEPAGRLILAVDRSVNGCHEAVLASEQRFGGRP